MITVSRPRFAAMTLLTFLVVGVGFVVLARGCAKALWPAELAMSTDSRFSDLRARVERIHARTR